MTVPERIERLPSSPPSALRRALTAGPWLGLLVPALLLVAWEIGAAAGALDLRYMPRPTQIVATGAKLLASGFLADSIFATVRRLLLGSAIGISAGVVAGFALGLSAALRTLLEPLLNALYTVPKLAILPLLLLVFGVGEIPLIALVAITVFFYMWLATMQAVTTLDPTYHDAATVFGVTPLQRLRHVVLPGVLPQLFANMRIAFGVGVLVVVGAEFVNASEGLGAMVWQSWSVFLTDRMYVGITVISLLGVGGMWVVQAIGEVMTPWTPAARAHPRRLLWAALAVVAIAVGLAGSRLSPPSSDESALAFLREREAEAFAPRPLAELTRCRIAARSGLIFTTPIFLAQAMGEFERENLNVEIVNTAEVDAFSLLARGDLDVVVGAPSAGFFNAARAGVEIRWVSALAGSSRGPDGIYIRRAAVADPEQPTWGDLVGRRVGSAQGLGGVISYLIARRMLDAGFDPVRVQYKRMRSPQDIGIALRQGALDAGWLLAPASLQAAEDPSLLYLGGTDQAERLSAVFFGVTFLVQDRDAGTAFIRALAHTIDHFLPPGWYENDETVAAVAELTETPAGLVREDGRLFDLDLPVPRTVERVQRVLARYPDVMASRQPLADDMVVDRGFIHRVFGAEVTLAGR